MVAEDVTCVKKICGKDEKSLGNDVPRVRVNHKQLWFIVIIIVNVDCFMVYKPTL